jgi:hypothetical protein
MQSVDVSHNPQLERLECDRNVLSSMVLSNNNKLKYLSCYTNFLKGAKLDTLISMLPDRSKMQERGYLLGVDLQNKEGNVITSYQVKKLNDRGWDVGQHLASYDTKYDGVHVNYITVVTKKEIGSDISFTCGTDYRDIQVDGATGAEILSGVKKTFKTTAKEINLVGNIYDFDCSNDEIETLDVTNDSALEVLRCNDNNIMSLELYGNPLLKNLICSHNYLPGISLSFSPLLKNIEIDNNGICCLDFTDCPGIETIKCYRNQINGTDASMLAYHLPDRSKLTKKGEIRFIDLEYNNERNAITTSQVKEYTSKGWIVEDKNGNKYAGKDPGVITFKTSAPINSYIKLRIDVNGKLSIDGLEGTYEPNKTVAYKLLKSDITITGDVTFLDCSDNKITSIELKNDTALRRIVVDGNLLTNIDVTNNAPLTVLYADSNKLSSLDVSHNPQLEILYCAKNNISNLDLSKNVALLNLICMENKLTSLDFSNNKEFTFLACYDNNIKGKNMDALIASLPDCTSLEQNGVILGFHPKSSIEGNIITKKQVADAKARGWLIGDNEFNYYYGSNVITFTTDKSVGSDIKLNIIANGDVSLDGLSGTFKDGEDVTYKSTSPNVTINGDVTLLDCSENEISALDVTQDSSLVTLYCYDNAIPSIDISKNNLLLNLNISTNKLSTIDVSKSPQLQVLGCAKNNISSLDFSKSEMLSSLDCSENNLTKLDMSNNYHLSDLWCYDNMIKDADMDALIASLVDRSSYDTQGTMRGFDPFNNIEHNVITKKQVADAKARGWNVTDADKNDYPGTDPSGISSEQADGATVVAIYNISGRRISKMQHGVNIVKMSNGRTKKVIVE